MSLADYPFCKQKGIVWQNSLQRKRIKAEKQNFKPIMKRLKFLTIQRLSPNFRDVHPSRFLDRKRFADFLEVNIVANWYLL